MTALIAWLLLTSVPANAIGMPVGPVRPWPADNVVPPSAGGSDAVTIAAPAAVNQPKQYEGAVKLPPYQSNPWQRQWPSVPMNPPGVGPGPNTNWDTYQYPDNYRFRSSDVGAGNIGNGLCTAKNANRTQVKLGYCAKLADILGREGSCANREMRNIIGAAGVSGAGITDLPRYCSNWSAIPNDKKIFFFQQLLATLITQESGWNTNAVEGAWFKNGVNMQGRGLFQIAVRDRFQDPDCAALNDQSIFDPHTNMKCGACIALKYLAKDRAMGHGTGDSGARGMARYFGPLRDMQRHKRGAMASATNQWCVANGTAGDAGAYAAVSSGGGREPAASEK